MRPLIEVLEDERTLLLKLDTVRQNMIRYGTQEAQDVLIVRRDIIKRDLAAVRKEIREYMEELFK